jgi:transcriptional regulator with XRE-family HTH domain
MAVDRVSGAQIKDARERRHLTQQQLADVLGVDRKTVDNWENGRTSPRNRTGALKAWAPELAGGEPEPWELEIRAMKTFNDEQKDALIRGIKAQREQQGDARSERAS